MKKILTITSALLLAFTMPNIQANVYDKCANHSDFLVGTGIYDITGPAAERGMMGYADTDQHTNGVLQRLWARAFIFASPCNDKRVVFISADLGQSFESLKQGVLRKLADNPELKHLYTAQNLMINATHSHSGPGGYAFSPLYNLSTLGFSKKNYQVIVNGIYQAIKRAHTNLMPGTLKFNQGDVEALGYNRSPDEYHANPQEERDRYASNIDRNMPLLRIENNHSQELGMLAFHAMHGTTKNKKNTWISGDIQGYSSQMFEKSKHSDYGPKAFVAAFAQAHSGDISPNAPDQPGKSGRESIKYTAEKGQYQLNKALDLYHNASKPVKGGIDYRLIQLHAKIEIESRYADGKTGLSTCEPALGISMLAGTADGEGFGRRGVSCRDKMASFSDIPFLNAAINELFCEHTQKNACQGNKPTIPLLTMSRNNPLTNPDAPMVTTILPMQLFIIGDIAIAGVPMEVTTMAGRRLAASIKESLKDIHVNEVIIAGLSNAYVGYLTTHEEYDLQGYEGASNQYGPWTLYAMQQEFSKLGHAIVKDEVVNIGEQFKYTADVKLNFQTGVVADNTPSKSVFEQFQFGDTIQDALPSYPRDTTVSVSFWSGHPKNALCLDGEDHCEHNLSSFLYVEKKVANAWKVVKTDNDLETLYEWKRAGDCLLNACSLSTISWFIPNDASPGEYRIRHVGYYKDAWSGERHSYQGISRAFLVK